MTGLLSGASFRFLFRDDRGTIDRRTWWLAVAIIVAAWLAVFELERILNRSGDISKVALTAALVFATIFLLVCYYFVSAKRFNARRRPADFALFLPAAIFVATGLRWLGPSLVEVVPDWLHYLSDSAALAIALWNIAELGLLPDSEQDGTGR
jgi:uncharacterized membrane protein YhaH (DUF805 family)